MADLEKEPMTGVSDEDRSPEHAQKDKKKAKKDKSRRQEEERSSPEEPEGKCTCNLSFFLSLEGMLKVVEFVSTLNVSQCYICRNVDSYSTLSVTLTSLDTTKL